MQHLLGAGHLYRVAAIAARLAALGVDTHVVTGGRPVPGLDWSGVTLHQLPAAYCAPGDFTTLLDERGNVVTPTWRERRRDQLLRIAGQVAPRVAVIESFPFARRQLAFELLPLLEGLRERGCRLVCSIRDVLQPRSKPQRNEQTLAVLNANFSTVLVHADPAVVALQDSFPLVPGIACELCYTGYVTASRAAMDTADGDDEVVVSAGGGAVGTRLLETALQARRAGCQRERTWRFLVGASSPPAWQGTPDAGVIIEPARPDFPRLLDRCALSISQAGYNTITDVLAASCRSLVVPYAKDGEVEQSQRAQRLQALGLLQAIQESHLDPGRLASAADALLAQPPPQSSRIDLGGTQASAELLADLAGQPA